MKIKKLIALLVAFSALSMNVAYAASSNNPPSSNFFANSWDKTAKTDAYQFSCKKTLAGAKGGTGLTAEGQATVDLLKATSKVYKEKTDNILILKDNKIKATKEKINVFEKIAVARTAEDIKQSIENPGKKSMTIMISGDSIYYNYNGGEAMKTGWKSFIHALGATSMLNAVAEKNLTSSLNQYSFKFTRWISAGKNRNAVFEGKMTTEETMDMVKFYVGDGTGFTFDPAKTKLTIDERTGNWLRADSVVTIRSANPSYEIQVKEACTFNFKSKVKVSLPKNAQVAEDADAAGQEMSTLMSELD